MSFNSARGYSLSPPPPLRGPPPPLTQGRLGYAPFSRKITQYQLPPPMRGKWRAQRADGGAHAARGFVGGAACPDRLLPHGESVSMPHAALWVVQRSSETHTLHVRAEFQCRTRLCGWCSEYPLTARNRASDVSMPHAALWVVQPRNDSHSQAPTGSFNAARGFVGGAAESL